MIVVITEVMVSVVIEAMIEEITVVEVVLIAIAEMEEVLIAIAEMEAVMIVIVEMVAVMIVIAEMEEDITGETAVVMIAEVDITVIEDLQNVMVMIPQRRDQGYNCKNVLLPWNPHPHLPVLLFLVAQNQLTPQKKKKKLKKNCKNNKKT